MSKVNVGLVQMSCVADKEANLNKAIDKDTRSSWKRRANCLPAGTVHFALFLRCGRV